MYGIARDKQKVTPQTAIQIVEKYGGTITYQEAEALLEMIYNFANLALNQQLQFRSEGQDQLIHHPGPG